MRDYKSSNEHYKSLDKRKLIESIILMSFFICYGVFYGITTLLGLLEHYGIIHNTWEIVNFSWFNLILSFVIIFCFIYFPIRSIIRGIKRYKRISNIVDKVTDEYKQELEANKDVTETKQDKEINFENKPKITLSEEEMKKMDFKAPTFAKRNRWLYVILFFIGIGILEVAGIGMLINPKGNNMHGWICVIAGVVYLLVYIQQLLTEFKGKLVYGKLLSLERRKLRHGYSEYVLVALNGKVMDLSLPFDSVNYNQWDYNDGMALLKKYMGKEIPLRVLGRNVIIDWKKMYWESQ